MTASTAALVSFEESRGLRLELAGVEISTKLKSNCQRAGCQGSTRSMSDRIPRSSGLKTPW